MNRHSIAAPVIVGGLLLTSGCGSPERQPRAVRVVEPVPTIPVLFDTNAVERLLGEAVTNLANQLPAPPTPQQIDLPGFANLLSNAMWATALELKRTDSCPALTINLVSGSSTNPLAFALTNTVIVIRLEATVPQPAWAWPTNPVIGGPTNGPAVKPPDGQPPNVQVKVAWIDFGKTLVGAAVTLLLGLFCAQKAKDTHDSPLGPVLAIAAPLFIIIACLIVVFTAPIMLKRVVSVQQTPTIVLASQAGTPSGAATEAARELGPLRAAIRTISEDAERVKARLEMAPNPTGGSPASVTLEQAIIDNTFATRALAARLAYGESEPPQRAPQAPVWSNGLLWPVTTLAVLMLGYIVLRHILTRRSVTSALDMARVHMGPHEFERLRWLLRHL